MSAPKICPTCGTEYPADERFCPRDGSALKAQGGGADLIGSIIADRYLVLAKLGEGGMGQVYLAEHVKMGRKSAVKVMNPGTVNDADAISRFNREAANASRISHQHVAQVYDFGETSDGLIYLAMEYVEGEPLTDILARDGALPPERAGEIVRQTAEALSVAHDMGIVHRDLKPDNIMLAKFRDGSDCVKVVDFGIAKAAGIEAQKVTRTGLVIGTPEYMSPEQIAGDPLDARSDIYSLGLVAFNILTGRLPFPSKTAQESVIMRLTEPPVRLEQMRPQIAWTPAVQQVMDRALQRDAAQRYASANEFGRALSAAVQGLSTATHSGATKVMAEPDAWVPPTRVTEWTAAGVDSRVRAFAGSRVRSRKGRLAAVAGVVVLAAAALTWVFTRGGTDADATTTSGASAGAPSPATPSVTSTPVASPVAATASQAGTAVPDRSTRRAEGRAPQTVQQQPVGSVTAPSGNQSYGVELRALEESIADSASAVNAMRRVSILKSRVTLASDAAAVQFVEAKATMLTSGAAKGCALMRRIKPGNLGAGWREQFTEGLQTCEGN
ncbi:MAG: protein kinase domain-containing protein [Gemmatimonadaceae bacterium]